MISADTSQYLAKLIQTLPLKEQQKLRKDFEKATSDDDLVKWLAMPLPTASFLKPTTGNQ